MAFLTSFGSYGLFEHQFGAIVRWTFVVGCLIVGLLHCWIASLLDCCIVGLLHCCIVFSWPNY